MTDVSIMPGDFAVVLTGSRATPFITGMEALRAKVDHVPYAEWDHAVVCTGWQFDPGDGTPSVPLIVEAQPGGAVEVPWHYEGRPHKWSSGIIRPTTEERAAIVQRALAFATLKTPYSVLDYFALLTHSLHVPVPGLREYIQSTRHEICSQLVDDCYQQAGMHLFTDNRWPGYVTPSDLGALLA